MFTKETFLKLKSQPTEAYTDINICGEINQFNRQITLYNKIYV